MKKTPLKRSPAKPKAKKKKSESARLLKKADDLAREYSKREPSCCAEGYSFECGNQLQWCHLITRGEKYIRHNPLNFVRMCAKHHIYFGGHPHEWTKFIESKFPGRWDELDLIQQQRVSGIAMRDIYQQWIDFYEQQ